MSWYFEVAGSQEAVKAAVGANPYIPEAVKTLIADRVSVLSANPGTVAHVLTSGHFDDLYGGECAVKVNVIELASS